MAKCKNCTNLYNLSDENDVIVGKWCPKTNDSPDVEAERECGYYKRMTQGDRIRAMSDDELADFMYAKDIPWCDDSECPTETLCKDCFRKWLQSEVEE